ncbi:zinc finger protein 37 [Drosophila eugracilis]|uniref:zinc finger protein 37 n=1 Tax=Drosophila eugracilis TaxID=29029 RepID=UPI0007E7C536|nr:zinc finger protein 37 [Drosophila eugracilis]
MLDISQMCRVCRDESDCLVDLFAESCSSIPNQEKEPYLATMLRDCSGCSVLRADGMPQFICVECAESTRKAYRLRRQCRKSHKYFDQLRRMVKELEGIEGCLEVDKAEVKDGAITEAFEQQVLEDIFVELVELKYKSASTKKVTTPEGDLPIPTPENNEPKNIKAPTKRPIIKREKRKKSCSDNDTWRPESDADERDESPIKSPIINADLGIEHVYKPNPKKVTNPEGDLPEAPAENNESKNIKAPIKKPIIKREKRNKSYSENDTWSPQSDADEKDDENWGQTKITKTRKKKKVRKIFQCNRCDLSFGQNIHLEIHMRTHTGERPYKCSYCSQSFAQKGNLGTHIRCHTGERPFACTMCPRRFRQMGQLSVHTRIHTGERRYKCKICRLRFQQNVHLQKHMAVHTGVKFEPGRQGAKKITS